MESRILVVEPGTGGAAEFSSISEAIRAAVVGDTILLKAGFYEEKVLMDKAVHIVVDSEAEPGDTVVTSGMICTAPSGSITNLVIQQLVDIRSGGVVMQNCEVTLGSDGIRIGAGANPTIKDCKIHNIQGGGAGVYFQEGSLGTLEGCHISNVRNDGVHVKASEAATIINCEISHCPNGVYFRQGARGLVEGNAIHHCTQFGIYIQSGSEPIVSKNSIDTCDIHAVLVSQKGGGTIRDNVVTAACSVRIYAGCSPVLGINSFAGLVEQDAVAAPVA